MKPIKKFGPRYGFKRFAGGGGVPTTGGIYDQTVPQYPFPSQGGDTGPTSNMTVSVHGQEAQAGKEVNPFKNPNVQQDQDNPIKPMRKGGKVKTKRVRGDGIAQRGKTRGRFV